MTREEYLADMWSFYSDVHKDAYGYRPRGEQIYNWFTSMTSEEMDVEFQQLQETINRNDEHQRQMEADACVAVEEHIESLIRMGAGDRENAIRWMDEAEETNGDLDYLCYKLGVPYGYFGKEYA